MKDNTFIKEFERLAPSQKETCAKFWECDGDAKSIFNVLELNLLDKLEKLNRLETILFFNLINSHETLSENQLKSMTGLENEEVSFAIETLREKMFVYVRKSISKLSHGNDKIIIFEIIKEVLADIEIKHCFNDFDEVFEAGRLYISYPDENLLNLFFENGGYLKHNSKHLKKVNLDKLVKNSLLEKKIVFAKDKMFSAYTLNMILIKPYEPKPVKYHSNGLKILNDLGRMYYVLSTKNVLLNKNGELCKYDFELLVDIFKSKDILAYFVETMTNVGLLYEESKKLLATSDFKDLVQKDFVLFYKDFLFISDKIQLFSDLFLKDNFEYCDYDIRRIALKEDLDLDELFFLNSLLIYAGLVDNSEKNTYTPSKLFYSVKYNSLFAYSDEPSLIVNTNFTVVSEASKLSFYDEFILNTFFNFENSGNIKIFKIDKKSFYKGLFLGFDPNIAINILKEKSSKPVPEMIYVVINDWINSYKEAKIEKVVVIKGAKETLDLIFYNKDIEKYIIKRHGDTLLEISEEAASIKMLEDDNIFIIGN